MPRDGSGPWIALVGPEVEENLSLRYLASSLERAGLRAEIFPFNAGADLPALVEALDDDPPPAVIALSLSFQWRAADVLALALRLRQRGFQGHVTTGGHFASFAWREVMRDFPEVDTICRFEAEDTLRELCAEVIGGGDWRAVPGLAVRDDQGIPELTARRAPPVLSTLADPDRRGPPASCLGHRIAPMISSRGCYSNCSFCCIATLHRDSSPAERHRLRNPGDVADEMARLHHERGIDVFIFHDDNFFLPRKEDSLRRVSELGDALEARGVRRFATVVKARPNDVSLEVFSAMRERLRLVRLFLGVESSTHQGCRTLNRGVKATEAARALGVLEALDLYVCFNLLVFDPDASLEALLENMRFMQARGQHPSNFGRVELYAGTPLLERLLQEGRTSGDYLGWSYEQATPEMERVFLLTMQAFHERNFSGRALANRLQSTRFDVEVARHFHPELFQSEWLNAARGLSQRLAADSARAVRAIVAHVRSGVTESADEAFIAEISAGLRACEADIDAQAWQLEKRVSAVVGAACDHAPRKGIPIGGPRSSSISASGCGAVA
jgi:anaerobic magnesium-protoporphyrin IX monomethyl ester cyclase